MFNFFKKKDEGPPDVGQEDEFDKRKSKGRKEEIEEGNSQEDDSKEENNYDEELEEEVEKRLKGKSEKKGKFKKSKNFKENSGSLRGFDAERANAKIEALNSMLKALNEGLSIVNQQIGEVRGMVHSNEKSILKLENDSVKAVDIVKEVKPEKLRLDYQKIDMKVNSLAEKLEADKQMEDAIMNEVKDLRNKAGIFVGTDALLKLNEDVKKDLISLQGLGSKVKMNADKSEDIFIELRKKFTETQKLNEIANNLDNSYSGLKKELEKVKLDHSSVITDDDFEDYKKQINSKLALLENSISEINKMKENNEKIMEVAEKTLLLSKKNKEDIDNIAITVGDDKIERVNDYENEISSILKIIDTIAGQVNNIKKKVGIKDRKISVKSNGEKITGKDNLKMENVEISPELLKPLVSKKEEVIKKVHLEKKQRDEKSPIEIDESFSALRSSNKIAFKKPVHKIKPINNKKFKNKSLYHGKKHKSKLKHISNKKSKIRILKKKPLHKRIFHRIINFRRNNKIKIKGKIRKESQKELKNIKNHLERNKKFKKKTKNNHETKGDKILDEMKQIDMLIKKI